jgi:hypothetical protein
VTMSRVLSLHNIQILHSGDHVFGMLLFTVSRDASEQLFPSSLDMVFPSSLEMVFPSSPEMVFPSSPEMVQPSKARDDQRCCFNILFSTLSVCTTICNNQRSWT